MDYRTPSRNYLNRLRKITDDLVEFITQPDELESIAIRLPGTEKDLSHEGTIRAIIQPVTHYMKRAAIVARRNNDHKTYEILMENVKRLIDADSKIPSRTILPS